MGHQTVVDGGGGQHPQQIQRKGPEDCSPSDAVQQHQQTTDVGQGDDRWAEAMEQASQAVRTTAGSRRKEGQC